MLCVGRTNLNATERTGLANLDLSGGGREQPRRDAGRVLDDGSGMSEGGRVHRRC